MTGPEFAGLVELIEDLWPGTRSWRVEKVFPQFADYSAAHAHRAVTKIFGEGRQVSPSPSMVMKGTAESAAEDGIHIRPGTHQHTYAHIPPSQAHLSQSRGPGLRFCVDPVCPRSLQQGGDEPCHDEECRSDSLYAPSVQSIKAAS